MFKSAFAALIAAASVLVAGSASAEIVLDQATIPETGHTNFSGSVGWVVGPGGLAQSFTVGVSGRLDHIALDVENATFLQAPASDIRFSLLDGSFGLLLSRDIAAANLPIFDFSGFDWSNVLNIDLSSAGIDVVSGETLILKVSSLSEGNVASLWRADNGVGIINYPGGQAYTYDVPPGFTGPVAIGNEFGFRTYVDVPEPSSWALMIIGFGMIGGAVRRGRSVALGCR